MKRLLLIAAAALMLPGMTAAATMPKELQGVWCVVKQSILWSIMERCPQVDASIMTVDVLGFSTDGVRCDLLKVIKRRPAHLAFHCVEREGEFVVEQIWDGPREGGITVTVTAKLSVKHLPRPIFGGSQ